MSPTTSDEPSGIVVIATVTVPGQERCFVFSSWEAANQLGPGLARDWVKSAILSQDADDPVFLPTSEPTLGAQEWEAQIPDWDTTSDPYPSMRLAQFPVDPPRIYD